MTEREALLQKVQAASFAVDDVKLFLDSHPDNAEALCYFEKYKLLSGQCDYPKIKRKGEVCMLSLYILGVIC